MLKASVSQQSRNKGQEARDSLQRWRKVDSCRKPRKPNEVKERKPKLLKIH